MPVEMISVRAEVSGVATIIEEDAYSPRPAAGLLQLLLVVVAVAEAPLLPPLSEPLQCPGLIRHFPPDKDMTLEAEVVEEDEEEVDEDEEEHELPPEELESCCCRFSTSCSEILEGIKLCFICWKIWRSRNQTPAAFSSLDLNK